MQTDHPEELCAGLSDHWSDEWRPLEIMSSVIISLELNIYYEVGYFGPSIIYCIDVSCEHEEEETLNFL